MRRLSPRLLLTLLAYVGFVSLGLPDAVLGIAWPSLRAELALAQSAFGWILLAGASGYFLSGLFVGRIIARAGVGTLLFGSTALAVSGVFGYAVAPTVGVFAFAAAVVGWGSGAIDAGLNTYAARHFPPEHMAWLHAAYSAGAALGSFTMALFVARAGGVRAGYTAVALLLTALAFAFFATRRLWSRGDEPASGEPTGDRASSVGVLQALGMGRVQLGALAFFAYSGIELGTGHWAYSILRARGFSSGDAGLAVTTYWASIFGGRVLAGFVVSRIGSVRLVRAGTVFAVLGSIVFATATLPPALHALGLAVVGLAIAPIYPGLMSETPRRMGSGAVAHAVGFQVSAAVAGAVVLPALGGYAAEAVGLEATAAFVAGCAVLLLLLHEALMRVPEMRRAPSGESPATKVG